MSSIPKNMREEMANDPFYSTCARNALLEDHTCQGRITWEHAMYYAGRKIQAKWAVVPLCEFAHSVNHFQEGGILNKQINRWIALNRATDKELNEFPKGFFTLERNRLNKIMNSA